MKDATLCSPLRMPRVIIPLLIGFSFLLIVIPVPAQSLDQNLGSQMAAAHTDEVQEQIRELLLEGGAADVAWAAHLARTHEVKESTPLLLQALKTAAIDSSPNGQYAALAILDALIQSKQPVPADELMAYQKTPYLDQIIILLSRNPGDNASQLLTLIKENGGGVRWKALSNLLVATKAPGFAATLMAPLEIHATVSIVSENMGVGPGHGFACGCGFGPPAGQVQPAGFPPIFDYEIVQAPVRDSVVFAPGRTPVYYQRGPYGSLSGVGSSGCTSDTSDSLRLEYLAQLLDTYPDGLGISIRPQRTIVFENEASEAAGVAQIRKELEDSYSGLVDKLKARGLLSDSEAASLKPNIELEIVDRRQGN